MAGAKRICKLLVLTGICYLTSGGNEREVSVSDIERNLHKMLHKAVARCASLPNGLDENWIVAATDTLANPMTVDQEEAWERILAEIFDLRSDVSEDQEVEHQHTENKQPLEEPTRQAVTLEGDSSTQEVENSSKSNNLTAPETVFPFAQFMDGDGFIETKKGTLYYKGTAYNSKAGFIELIVQLMSREIENFRGVDGYQEYYQKHSGLMAELRLANSSGVLTYSMVQRIQINETIKNTCRTLMSVIESAVESKVFFEYLTRGQQALFPDTVVTYDMEASIVKQVQTALSMFADMLRLIMPMLMLNRGGEAVYQHALLVKLVICYIKLIVDDKPGLNVEASRMIWIAANCSQSRLNCDNAQILETFWMAITLACFNPNHNQIDITHYYGGSEVSNKGEDQVLDFIHRITFRNSGRCEDPKETLRTECGTLREELRRISELSSWPQVLEAIGILRNKIFKGPLVGLYSILIKRVALRFANTGNSDCKKKLDSDDTSAIKKEKIRNRLMTNSCSVLKGRFIKITAHMDGMLINVLSLSKNCKVIEIERTKKAKP